ncbi:siderophore-iron reductase FhuF [Halomonas sp. MCCC 1A11036]|uniref:Siderophore-iron reductase FhuF n=1 Tax=Billgrantia zhangzhouensis TaxID=2733481 RepID=A0ABS9AE91_9GAMM|nr:siderophore-iron reductase FhuF [Halomonas zhangzhouensis]MCE8020039.1 siderophore-iron reductase FhuF [Halomonas zhangzhouensis]
MTEMAEVAARLEDPAEALLALYRQPPLDKLKAPRFGVPDVPTIVASALLDHEELEAVLGRFMATFGEGADRKAAVSIWSKFHFSSVSIPTLVANLLLKQALPVGLSQMRLELAKDGRPAHIWLPEGAEPLLSQDPLVRFDYLFDDHCAPVVEALAAISGLSPKVFWSNLGHYVEFVGKTCSQHPLFEGAGEPLLRYLEARTLPDGRRNPLYLPVRYLELGGEAPTRVRRLCCVKYRLPDEPLCGGCPLKPENRPAKPSR